MANGEIRREKAERGVYTATGECRPPCQPGRFAIRPAYRQWHAMLLRALVSLSPLLLVSLSRKGVAHFH